MEDIRARKERRCKLENSILLQAERFKAFSRRQSEGFVEIIGNLAEFYEEKDDLNPVPEESKAREEEIEKEDSEQHDEFISPYNRRKTQSLRVGALMKSIGDTKQGERTLDCAGWFEFLHCKEDARYKVRRGSFCKNLMCPVCQNGKSIKKSKELQEVAHHVSCQYPTYRYLVLTLTVPSIPKEELKETINRLFKGWKKLVNHTKLKKVVKGWLRALEVTYNAERDDYHPHIHSLLVVPSGYFKKNYIKKELWLEFWRESYKDPSITQIWIEPLRKSKRKRDVERTPLEQAVKEVVKYSCKPTDFLDKSLSEKRQLEVFQTLSESLKGRRIYSMGGLFKKFKSNLEELRKAEQLREGKEPVAECHCEGCGKEMRAYMSLWNAVEYEIGKDNKPEPLPKRIKLPKVEKKESDYSQGYVDAMKKNGATEEEIQSYTKKALGGFKYEDRSEEIPFEMEGGGMKKERQPSLFTPEGEKRIRKAARRKKRKKE